MRADGDAVFTSGACAPAALAAGAKAGMLIRFVAAPLAELLVLRGIRNLLGLSAARGVLSGGSGLSAELFERFHAFGVPLGNLYGSTELGLVSAHRRGVADPQTM